MISEGVGYPQFEVSIQVNLSAARGVKVGYIAMDITFPAELVSFVKVERSGLSEAGGAQIEAEVKSDAEHEDKSILRLTILTLDQEGPARVIPDGPVAHIIFKISRDAQPGTDIVLNNKASGNGGVAVQSLMGPPGMVILLNVFPEQTVQVPFTEHDNVIEQLPA